MMFTPATPCHTVVENVATLWAEDFSLPQSREGQYQPSSAQERLK